MARIAVTLSATILSDAEGRPRRDLARDVVDDIAAARIAGHEVIVIASGAMLWGHDAIRSPGRFSVSVPSSDKRSGQRALVRRHMLAAVGRPLMMADYAGWFGAHGIGVAQLVMTRDDVAVQDRYERLVVVTDNLVRSGIVPVFDHDDVLAPDEPASGDDDRPAAMLAAALRADRLVILTTADRRYEATAAALAGAFGVDVVIADAARREALRALLLGDAGAATTIPARGHHVGQRRSWIALTARSRGAIVVSSFLAEKLAQRKAVSVLLIGIEEVVGIFDPDDVVTVKDVGGRILGRGQIRLSSDDLRDKVRKRERGEAIEHYGLEVIHCDYLVTSPALRLAHPLAPRQ
jgi:glutamate 5-kinase